MFDHNHYVPILKGKDGEFAALRELDPSTRAGLTPLIEIVPFSAATTLATHLQKVAHKLARAWMSLSRPVFVDTRLLGDATTLDGLHVLEKAVKFIEHKGIKSIPVTGLRRGDKHHAATRAVIKADSHGVCLRLAGEDFKQADALPAAINRLIKDLKTEKSNMDLLIDLRALGTQDAGYLVLMSKGVLSTIADLKKYRTLTIAGTAFPLDLRYVKAQSEVRTPRTEWLAWTALRSAGTRSPRIPTFGDYGIAHPELVKHEGPISVSGALRYTAEEEWVIVKGKSLKTEKHAQMHALCALLMEQPEYCGPDFSAGDRWISDCAERTVPPGNATTWRRVGTSHHLAYVVQALANLDGV